MSMTRLVASVAGIVMLTASVAVVQFPPAPQGLYAQYCASCHDRPEGARVLSLDALRDRTPEAILLSCAANCAQSSARCPVQSIVDWGTREGTSEGRNGLQSG